MTGLQVRQVYLDRMAKRVVWVLQDFQVTPVLLD